jgi:hypothetical protein
MLVWLGIVQRGGIKIALPSGGGIFLDGRRNAYQYNGRSVMRTDIGVSDYLSMLAIVAVLVSLWMH